MNQDFINNIKAILLGMLGSALLLLITEYISPFAKPIAVINLTSIVHDYIKTLAQDNLSQQESNNRIKSFSVRLEKNIQDLSRQYDVVILPQEAVLAGDFNLTPELIQKMNVQHS